MSNVTRQDTGTAAFSATGQTTYTYTGLTITSALVNSALVVALTFENFNTTGVSVTWNGVALTSIVQATPDITSATAGAAQLWQLINPAAGNQNLVINWTGADQVEVEACSYINVDQTGGTTSFPNSGFNAAAHSSPTTTSTINVASAVGNAVVAVHSPGDLISNLSSLNNNTIFIDNTRMGGGENDAAGASSVTMTGTWSLATQWVVVATDIKAAGALPPPTLSNISDNFLFIPGSGPRRSLRSKPAFPPTITQVMLSTLTSVSNRGRAAPTGVTPLSGRSSVASKVISGIATVLAGTVGPQVGISPGFLFRPGAGPTWDLKRRQAFPASVPGFVSLSAKSILSSFVRPVPSGTAPISGRAQQMNLHAKGGLPGIAAMSGRVQQMNVHAKAGAAGTLPLAARSEVVAEGRSAQSNALSLAAKSAIAVTGRGAPGLVGSLVALASRLGSAVQSRAGLAGTVRLAATVTNANAHASAGLGPLARLAALTAVAAKASASATGALAMSARTAAITKLRAAPSGALPLLAQSMIAVATRAGIRGATALAALTATMGQARSSVVGVVSVSARTAIKTSVRAGLSVSAALAVMTSRLGAAVHAGGAVVVNLSLSAKAEIQSFGTIVASILSHPAVGRPLRNTKGRVRLLANQLKRN